MNMTRIYINSVTFLKRKVKKLAVCVFFLSPWVLSNFSWDDA